VRNPVGGAQFRRDLKLAQKRGKDMAKLREVILLLIEGSPSMKSTASTCTSSAPERIRIYSKRTYSSVSTIMATQPSCTQSTPETYAPDNCAAVSSFNSGCPASSRRTFCVKMSQQRFRKCGLRPEPEMWGVRITFGKRHKGCSGGNGYW